MASVATKHDVPGHGSVVLCCALCGQSFRRFPSSAKRSARCYCSTQCQRADRTGERNPKWRGGIPKYVCASCGCEFGRYLGNRGRQGDGKYCSVECLHLGITINRDPETKRLMLRDYGRRREAIERASRTLFGHHTLDEWLQLLAAYKGRCAHCKSKQHIERDHIIPLSKGGNDLISNIQPLCRHCNRSKNNKVGRCGHFV